MVMIGPKALPIMEVPARCMANSTQRMAMVIKTTTFWLSPMMPWKNGIVRRPSMAVVTVTAGVRMPSASSAAPPTMAGMMSHLAQRFTRL